MSEPGQKRWVWDLYPLAMDTWDNRMIPDDGSPAGQRIRTSVRRPRGWISYLGSDAPARPLRVETIWRWAYVPTDDNLAVLNRCYPKDDPCRPSWDTIKGDLVVAGHAPDALDKLEAPVLLAMLAKAKSVGADTATTKTRTNKARTERMEPTCARLCADLHEEAGELDVSPPPLDDPAPQQYAWMEATAALLADAYGQRLDRAERFREQLINVKHASRSRELPPDDKREHQRMAKGLFEVLALAENAVSATERWRSDLWDRAKVFLPDIARDIQVVCAGIGRFDADRMDEATAEWRCIEVAAAEKRAAAGQNKWNLAAGTWTAEERAVWRGPVPLVASAREDNQTMSRDDRRSLSPEETADLLQKCLRRCCLCYALEGDDSRKDGQLAHLDRNRSNADPDNFVFLCFEHHNSYDAKMGQAKNLTEQELRRHRQTLYQAVEQGKIPARQGAAVPKFPTQQAASVNVNGDGNVVAGGDVNYVVNMPKGKRGKRAATRPPIIPGTVSEDPRMAGYLNYLVRRYEKFKKWDCDQSGQRMGWGVIRNSYKREMKYELIHTPKTLFEAGARYLQQRIENTRLGKMKQGQRLYNPFEDFDEQAGNDEDLPE